MRCTKCDKMNSELLKTAYGLYLCEDCWDDYICTDMGRLEYLIGICDGDYPVEEFDADFLIEVAESWKKFHNATELTPQQCLVMEAKARELGIL